MNRFGLPIIAMLLFSAAAHASDRNGLGLDPAAMLVAETSSRKADARTRQVAETSPPRVQARKRTIKRLIRMFNRALRRGDLEASRAIVDALNALSDLTWIRP